MRKLMDDVAAFHRACDVPVVDRPQIPPLARIQLRASLIKEEAKETIEAMCFDDIYGIADGLADLIYVAVGTALEYGIPLDRVWDEVQRSNMSKLDPETGKAIKRADGKILKGPSFSPPDISGVLRDV